MAPRNCQRLAMIRVTRATARPAVPALVAAVAELAQLLGLALAVDLEAGAGKVTKQLIRLRAKAFAPAPLEQLGRILHLSIFNAIAEHGVMPDPTMHRA